MSLTPELAQLKDGESSYEPSPVVRQQIGEKSLIALIGPSAVGKSTIAREIIRLGGSDFSEAYSSVTRPRRADDPEGYQTADEGFTIERATQLIKDKVVTNYSVHPSGAIYATLPENFPAAYNLLPLLPSSLSAMKKAGFRAVHAIYVTASIEALEAQLADRADDPSFTVRLDEGVASLKWGIAHKDDLSFVENIHGEPYAAATRIMSILSRSQDPAEKEYGLTQAHVMLHYLNDRAR